MADSSISLGFKIVDGPDGLKRLIVDADGLRKLMQANVTEAQKLQTGFINVSAAASAAKGIVDSLSGLLQSVTGDSLDFARAMKEANTMAGQDAAGFKAMKEDVAELAKRIPMARDALAKGLYQTISNGVPEDNWLSFLETSARSAVGGLANIDSVVGVTSTIIKNYGASWEDAGAIQDKIQLTAKNGVTSFEQLAAALPCVTGNAATLGVSVNELMATFATLTGVSGNTAEVVDKAAQMKTQVDGDIQKLKALMRANTDTSTEVKRLNDVYGKRLGIHNTAAEWYDILIKKSDEYIKQMAYEAEATVLEQGRNQAIARRLQAEDEMRAMEKDGSNKETVRIMEEGPYGPTFKEYTTDSKKYRAAAKRKKEAAEEAAEFEKRMRYAQRASEVKIPQTTTSTPKTTGTPTGVGPTGTPHPTKTDTPEVEPTDLSTLDAIGKRLQWLRKQRSMATAENIQHWNDEIAKAQEAEKALEEIGKAAETPYTPPTDLSQIATYEELNKAVSHYNKLMETASAADRTAIQQNINGLNDLKAQWDAMLDDLRAPAPLSALNSVEALTDAVSYYEKRLQTASASEVRAVAATVEAHKRKLAAIQREVELPAQLASAREINSLSGEEYRVKIKAMGFEELTGKIADLRRQLADTENPVTADQRRDIEELIATYAKWRLEGASAFDTFSAGWSGIKGVNGSILSMKEALEGTGTAWEKTTAVVDGFLQLYQGIMAVVDVIKTMKQLTEGLTVAKEAAAAATQGETMAENINTLSTQQSTAAKSEQIGTNSALTGSNMSVAASGFLAAHAWIPWVGLGIAVAAIGASVAMMASMKTKKFANGGIVSGPTLGLIGEYPGASSNPEVVAPLDKLRSIIEPIGGGAGGTVVVGGEMRVSGRDLVCVLANETRVASRTGRRTNIHL